MLDTGKGWVMNITLWPPHFFKIYPYAHHQCNEKCNYVFITWLNRGAFCLFSVLTDVQYRFLLQLFIALSICTQFMGDAVTVLFSWFVVCLIRYIAEVFYLIIVSFLSHKIAAMNPVPSKTSIAASF